MIGETTHDRVGDTAAEIASGTLTLVGNLVVPAAVESLGCEWMSGRTAAVTPTHQWACLVGLADLKVKAVSADLGTAAWAATTCKAFTWAAGYTPEADTPVYLGLLVVAGTVPTLNGAQAAVSWLERAPALCGSSSTGLTAPIALGTVVTAPTGGLSALPVAALK